MPPASAVRPHIDRAMALLKKLARTALGRPQPAEAIHRHPFDELHGVDTSGLLVRKHLLSGHAHDAFNTAYFGVPPSRFTHAVARWQTTPDTQPTERYRFIDVGCGKGRALLLASTMPFRDAIGIELNPTLAATAESNLVRWRKLDRPITAASVLCADGPSALPNLLHGPTLIYLYNPFEAPVLRALLAGILARQDHLNALVDILYLYPEHDHAFEEFPQFHRQWHEQITLAPEDENDGISGASDPCSLYRLYPGISSVYRSAASISL